MCPKTADEQNGPPTGPPDPREVDVEAQQDGAEPAIGRGQEVAASSGGTGGTAGDDDLGNSGDRPHHDCRMHRQPTTSSQATLCTNGTASGSGSDKPADSVAASEEFVVQPASYFEIAKHFGILGWTAFGGPAAHIAMFQQLFVDKLRWCTYVVFTELLMLGQCMPGPTSTQMGFAIGVLKKGLSGGLLSGVLFQGPGFLILAVLGWVASKVLDTPPDWLMGLVAGLAAAGVALVANAAVGLVKNICKGKLLQVLCTSAAVVAYYYSKPWTFPSLIVIGGLITLAVKRNEIIMVSDINAGVEKLGFKRLGGGILLASWVVILGVVVVLSGQIAYEDARELHWFAVFYCTGSLIFGGGQVVLPMLYNDVVGLECTTNAAGEEKCYDSTNSWMTTEQFNAGLALAQAMPGPLFNFAAYLGAVIAQNAGSNAIIGVILCWVGLFAPGIILIFGILPFWAGFRRFQLYRRALPGLNSTAVGLIVASVFQLMFSAVNSSNYPVTSICIGTLAYGATEVLRAPAPLVVVGGGVIGVIAWAADMK